MARNYIALSDIVNDIRAEISQDDYMKYRKKSDLMRWGKKALRELQMDVQHRVRSLRLDVNQDLNIVELPVDYVDYTKIGILTDDGHVVTLGVNNSLNISSDILLDSDDAPLLDSNGQYLTAPTPAPSSDIGNEFFDYNSYYMYRNYYYNGLYGRLFGLGGGNNARGYYRIDYDNNEIKLDIGTTVDKIILEYISDESMVADPMVHVFTERAIEEYIRWRSIKGLDNVNLGEKREAERMYIREKKKARARFNKFTPAEAMQTIFKTFTLAPKTGGNIQ